MARPAKSVAMKTGLMTKEEINARLENETRLKGGCDQLEAPYYLSDRQKEVFNFILLYLRESDILGNLDIFVLTQTAITIDRIQECEQNINENGMFDIEGNPNPAIKVKGGYMKEFFRLCNELSLSPQSRAKLANINFKAKEDNNDPLLSILGGGV